MNSLPSATGIGDLSNTAWNQNLPDVPSISTNNIPGADTLADKQDGVWFGNGNTDGFWSTSSSLNGDGIQVAIRASNRYGGNTFDTSAGGDSEFASVGAVELESDEGMKIDYSIRLLSTGTYLNLGEVAAAGGRFELAIDIDPAEEMVDFQAYDPVTFPERSDDGLIQVDHAFLSADGTTVDTTDGTNFVTDRANSIGMQNSLQPFFGTNSPAFDNPMSQFLASEGTVDPDAETFAIGM